MTKYRLPEFTALFRKVFIESTTRVSEPSAVCQTGRGVPQYLSREMAQSFTSESHSPNRPSRIYSGSQLIFLFSFMSLSRSSDMRIYQESRAKYMRGVLQRQ